MILAEFHIFPNIEMCKCVCVCLCVSDYLWKISCKRKSETMINDLFTRHTNKCQTLADPSWLILLQWRKEFVHKSKDQRVISSWQRPILPMSAAASISGESYFYSWLHNWRCCICCCCCCCCRCHSFILSCKDVLPHVCIGWNVSFGQHWNNIPGTTTRGICRDSIPKTRVSCHLLITQMENYHFRLQRTLLCQRFPTIRFARFFLQTFSTFSIFSIFLGHVEFSIIVSTELSSKITPTHSVFPSFPLHFDFLGDFTGNWGGILP